MIAINNRRSTQDGRIHRVLISWAFLKIKIVQGYQNNFDEFKKPLSSSR